MVRKRVITLGLVLGLAVNQIMLYQSRAISADSYIIPQYIMDDMQKNIGRNNSYNYNNIPVQSFQSQSQQYSQSNNYQYPTNYNSTYNQNAYMQPISANNYVITIPADIVVPFHIQGNYTSKNLTSGTRITAIISNDVYYNNILVFKQGTVGYLYPSYVNKAGRFGDQAQININSVSFRTVDGKEQSLSVDYSTRGKNVVYGASMGFFSKNKETELNSGTMLYGRTINAFPLSLR